MSFHFFSSLEQCRIIQFCSNLIGSQHQDKGNGRFEETHGSTIGIHAILHTITVSVCIQYIRIVQDRIISHQELLFETGIQDAADSQDSEGYQSGDEEPEE